MLRHLLPLGLFAIASPAWAGDTENVELFSHIGEVSTPAGKDLLVEIARGSADGVIAFGRGTAWRHIDGIEPIGVAVVEKVETNRSIVRITLDPARGIDALAPGDLVSLPARVPSAVTDQVSFELAVDAVIMTSDSGDLYAWREFVEHPEADIDARVMAAALADQLPYAEFTTDMPLPEGKPASWRYPGAITVADAMTQSDPDDVRDFLLFVTSFPGKYIGKTWKFPEIYATWILNGAPSSADEARVRGVSLSGNARKAYLAKIAGEFREGAFMDDWASDAWELRGRGDTAGARAIVELARDAAAQYGDPQGLYDADFAMAAQLSDEGDAKGAAEAYERALQRPGIPPRQRSSAYNNLAIQRSGLGEHQAALEDYAKALALREEAEKGASLKDWGAADSWRGMGDVYVALERYDDALDAYAKALTLYKSRSDLTGLEREASTLRAMGTAWKAKGSYRESLAAWEESVRIARELGWEDTVASSLDDLSGGWWNLGDYEKALVFQTECRDLRKKLGQDRAAALAATDMGSLNWNLGRHEAAVKLYEEALAIHRAEGDQANIADVLTRMGQLQRERGDYAASMTYFEEALAIETTRGVAAELADVHWEIALTRTEQKRWADVEASFTKALEFARQGGGRALEANLLDAWGYALYEQKLPAESVARFDEALRIRREIGDKAGECDSLINMSGYAMGLLADPIAARKYADEALAIARAMPSKPKEAKALAAIANVDYNQVKLQAAFDRYTAALAIYTEMSDSRGIAETENSIGMIYGSRGDYDNAILRHTRAMEVARAADLQVTVAASLDSIAWLEGGHGHHDQAMAHATEALALYEKSDNPWGLGNAYNTLASLSQDKGDYGASVRWHEKALAIRRESNDQWGTAGSLNNLGSLYMDMGDCDKATSYFDQALEIGRRIDYTDVLTVTVGNLAYCAAERGDFVAAEALAREGLKVAVDKELPPRIAGMHWLVGTVLRRKGDHAGAKAELEDALTRSRALGMVLTTARTEGQLGISAWESKDYAAAQAHLAAAAADAKKARADNLLWEPLFYLGRARRDAGDREGAIAAFTESVDIIERMRSTVGGAAQERFVADKEEVYRELIDLLAVLDRKEEAFRVAARMKGQELREMAPPADVARTAEERVVVAEGEELRGKERDLERLLRTELEKPAKQQRAELVAQWQGELDQVQLRFQDYTRALQKEHPDLASRLQVEPASFYKLRADLRANEVFVEPVVLPDRIVLFVVRGGEAPLLYREVKVSEIEVGRLVRDMRDALERPAAAWDTRGAKVRTASTSADPTESAMRLYELLVTPILGDLAGIDTIVVSPSGRLRYVPFAALYDGEKYLLETYKIALLTQSGTLAEHSPITKKGGVLAFGNPDGSLPGAEAEVQGIGKIWGKKGTRTYVGEAATKAELRKSVGTNGIVHLATHGFLLNDNPEGSYLLLAGAGEAGRLTFREIPLLALDDVDLAVLSACQTAVGDKGEGSEIAGLAYQFEMRGAASVIASLWAVNDASTSLLMTELYTRLRTPGITKAEALRQAQLALLASPEHQHPYYWAPFLLIGDWR